LKDYDTNANYEIGTIIPLPPATGGYLL
jgi:hypothetical protein